MIALYCLPPGFLIKGKLLQKERSCFRLAALRRYGAAVIYLLARDGSPVASDEPLVNVITLNFALDELYGLGWQHAELDDAKYETVTLEQVKAAAQKYLKPDSFVVSIVKPEK